ncbi:hypothetical protein GCM10009839_10280 [Catenulispora yoronensis]|uniref:Uncharacterized protein n=1 Tax=Catenulispora yoronensis TaxID=450799 RepID=A0ABN2TQI0_9ACTN
MSSTSAVAVLAQGLRDLRDFAEGPDGAELSEATGLSEQQIEEALGGEQLPTREVTLALVGAWEGDVEAWRAYWTQIAQLARGGGEVRAGKKQTVPVAPEPSIITALPAREPGTEVAAEGPDSAGEDDGERRESAEDDEAEDEVGSAEAQDASGDQISEVTARSAGQRGSAGVGAQEQTSDVDAETGAQEHAADADAEDEDEAGTGAESGEHSADAGAESGAQEHAAGADDKPILSTVVLTAAGSSPTPPEQPASATEGSAQSAPVPQAAGTEQQASVVDESAPVAQPAGAEPPPFGQAGSGAEPPPKKNTLARVLVPMAVFVVGVGVGAFGDHALNSKNSASAATASVPTAAQSSSSAAATPGRSSQSPSASAGGVGSSSSVATPGGSSGSFSSSSASDDGDSASSSGPSSSASLSSSSGSTLGSYYRIQLASGYSVDFLNDPNHPVSGTANGPDSMGFFATSFVDGKFYADQVAILDSEETGSYTACRNDTRYQHDVPLSQVSAGSGFCIHTETGHLVLVTVRRMPSSTDANPYAVVDVTVWQS